MVDVFLRICSTVQRQMEHLCVSIYIHPTVQTQRMGHQSKMAKKEEPKLFFLTGIQRTGNKSSLMDKLKGELFRLETEEPLDYSLNRYFLMNSE